MTCLVFTKVATLRTGIMEQRGMAIGRHSNDTCCTRRSANAGNQSNVHLCLRFRSKTTRGVPSIMVTPLSITVLRCFACISLLLFSSIESQCQKVSDPATRLASCRRQIDATDQQIVVLLERRARIVAEVGKIKKEAHLPVAAPAREEQVLDPIAQP